MLKANKKTKFVHGKKIWTADHDALVKQLFVDGVINPGDIRKSSVSWIFTDPKYPIFANFNEKDKWIVLQRNLKRLSTVFVSEQAAAGGRLVVFSSKSKFISCFLYI